MAPPTTSRPDFSSFSIPFLRPSDIFPPRHVFLDHLSISFSPYDADSDFSRIITPYSSPEFQCTLESLNLLHLYPELPFKLSHGFPIGSMTPIFHSTIPHNHPSIKDFHDDIKAYILDELRLGRFSGPFTPDQLYDKIGPFRSSPFQIVVKPGLDGAPAKIRVCRNLSHRGASGRSVNDEINSDDFPTRWGSAELTASVVSSFSSPASFLGTVDALCRTGPFKPSNVLKALRCPFLFPFLGCFFMLDTLSRPTAPFLSPFHSAFHLALRLPPSPIISHAFLFRLLMLLLALRLLLSILRLLIAASPFSQTTSASWSSCSRRHSF